MTYELVIDCWREMTDMFNGIFHIPQPRNEPCLQYGPGSGERSELGAKLKERWEHKG
jgi:hypothetical protein